MAANANRDQLSDTIVHLTIMVEAIQLNIDRASAAAAAMQGLIVALSRTHQAEPAPAPRRHRRRVAEPSAAVSLVA